MGDVFVKSKFGRRIIRNTIVGLCGFAAALTIVLLTMHVGKFVPAWFSMLVVYCLPLPVACGLAVGFVTPRKAIAWAQLWSGILFVLISSLFCGMRPFEDAAWSTVILLTIAGAIIAAMSGYAGQKAAERGYTGRFALVLLVLCAIVGGSGRMLMENQKREFLLDGKQHILMELDRDYFALPRGMDWSCDRVISHGSYVLTSQLNKQPMRIYAHVQARALRYIDYELPGGSVKLSKKADALSYLKALGVRDPFIFGLANGKGCWSSMLRGTRLTVWPNGRVIFNSVQSSAVPTSKVNS